ncbi:LysR substrate-binding domain-containing protein [Variovorax rhizosphaerae]|uniref:LysR substrate-binding domain-containing protein n=1 Tax=Variovorax rhizosphaerae TaxID=1836200 RepID=A0ABU8WTC1_9BURK
MELRQLRYYVRLVELGSITRAAKDLHIVTSALSQQMSRLESELSTRLLQRSAAGVCATDAGIAFYRQAQLTLRHADGAVRAAQQARLSGQVGVGIGTSASAVLAMPFISAMHERYPDIRLHVVDSLSTNLAAKVNARELDLAVVMQATGGLRGSAEPLVHEQLCLIGAAGMPQLQGLLGTKVRINQLTDVPMVLSAQGLRDAVDAAFAQAGCQPRIALEVDGLSVVMDAVRAGIGATILPRAAILRMPKDAFICVEIADPSAHRITTLLSLAEDELSPAALAARVVLRATAETLVQDGRWPGAELHKK